MKTATIQNTALVEFSNGTKHLYKTTDTIPNIQQRFALGKKFYTNEEKNEIVYIKAVTIGRKV